MGDYKYAYKSLNKFLKEKRQEKGLSQGDVREVLGLESNQFISNFERNMCNPSIAVLVKLVDLYRITQEEVIALMLKDQEEILRKNLREASQAKEKSS